jgi:hypothetical protein
LVAELHAYVSTFWAPKRGAPANEYEDASCIGPDDVNDGEVVAASLRIAVADGATESLLAGRWASALVRAFAQSHRGFTATYKQVAGAWPDIVASYCAEREDRGVPIQWYEQPGLQRGAYATLLVAEFSDGLNDGRARTWRALAVGDSCIFQVRDEALYTSFPISSSSQFSSSPALVSSRAQDPNLIRRHMQRHRGDWQPGDGFYLMTDAIAAWFLRAKEGGFRPWETLRDLGTTDTRWSFEDWVAEHRAGHEMRDDDTTLVRLDIF